MRKKWALTLSESGFSGVTFSKRPDVKYGVRPIPYYEIDGDIKLLQEIQNELFKYGINSTLSKTKYFNSLQVIGIDNCLTLCEAISVNDGWASSLKDDFRKGAHLTEAGIKKLFIEFGKKSQLTYDEVCTIIDAAKQKRLNDTLQKIMDKKKPLKLLPIFDLLYNKINTKNEKCIQCNRKEVKIYFTGKYPRKDNLFFLCDECAAEL